jgi:N-acetylglucosaminylphosphatidylinositol deacetylase
MLPTNYTEALDFLSNYFNIGTSLTHTLDYLRESIDHLVADLAFILIGYFILCIVLYQLICSRFGRFLLKPNRFPDNPNPKRVLLVTAHPDDECMFFGPTVLALLRQQNCRVFVLCLSNGYSKRIGRLRRLEVIKACEALGIGASDVTVMNMTCLQDDPKVEWKVEIMAPVILRQIETLDIGENGDASGDRMPIIILILFSF